MATLKVTNIKNESFAGDQLYLKTDGTIGIGTTSPSRKLHLVGSNAMILIEGSGGNGRQYSLASSDDTTGAAVDGGNPGTFAIYDDTANASRLVINSSGNVGIGTTSPSSKIDIHCGSDNTGLQITSTDAGAFASYFDNTGASTIGHSGTDLTLSCDPAGSVGSSNIVFQVDSNNERMRIDSSGRLLLGTTTEGHSNGDDLTIATSGNTGITLRSGSSSNGNIFFSDATSGAGEYEGMIWYAHGTNSMRFATSQIERLQIGSDGTVTVESEDVVFGTTNKGIEFPNSVSIKQNLSNLYVNLASGNNNVEVQSNGTSFVKLRGTNGDVELVNGNLVISTAGKGIDFSATAGSGNSELLSDYEHGNWVPTSASGGWTVSNTYSKYVKIGNLVHLQMYIGLSGTGTGDALEFGGMPFGAGGNGYSVGTVDFGEGGIKGTYMRTKSGSSSLSFLYPSENTSSNRLNLAANQVGDSYVIATITYVIDGT